MKDYNFLLDRDKAEEFLNQHSAEIFGNEAKIKINELKRSNTYNPEAFNILYDLQVGKSQLHMRASTSQVFSKEHDYNVMLYLREHGFSEGDFTIPSALAFLREENLLFYENLRGERLSDFLAKGYLEIESEIKGCAALAKKFHLVEKPTFGLFDSALFFRNFRFNEVNAKFPQAQDLGKIVQEIMCNLPQANQTFCHGDFNPNNILLDNGKISLIDFGLTTIFHKEVDLASFLTHLRLMLGRESDHFANLKDAFLKEYGAFDEKILQMLMILIDIRLLEISIIFQDAHYDSDFLYNSLQSDLGKLNNGS